MPDAFVIIDASDDVATVLAPMQAHQSVNVTVDGARTTLTLLHDIPYGHKFALRPIASGQPVRKYGAAIGLATADIAAGAHVHTHNITSNRFRGDKAKG